MNKFHWNFLAQRKEGSNLVISYLVFTCHYRRCFRCAQKSVSSKQVGTKLPNDLIMILINRLAVVRSAVNLLPKVGGKQYLVRQ